MTSDDELSSTKVEFAIKIKGQECVEKVKSKLIQDGKIQEKSIECFHDDNELRICVDTNRPWVEVHELIERTGYESALVGFSEESAVSILDKGHDKNIKGVVRFCNIPNGKGIVIDGVVDGLQSKTFHKLSICEYGDISDGYKNLGDIYRESSYSIESNELGRATIRTVDNKLVVSELIGRSISISRITDEKIACGIISRSSGIFQNFKRICLCSGKLLWDERDLPKIVRS